MASSCNPGIACTCTYKGCPRWGKCCECIAYHNAKKQVPGCLFSTAGEALWDRSFEALVKDRA